MQTYADTMKKFRLMLTKLSQPHNSHRMLYMIHVHSIHQYLLHVHGLSNVSYVLAFHKRSTYLICFSCVHIQSVESCTVLNQAPDLQRGGVRHHITQCYCDIVLCQMNTKNLYTTSVIVVVAPHNNHMRTCVCHVV